MVVGLVVAGLSGWAVAIVVAPILAIGLPYLLVLPKARDVELLEDLDRWVRALAASMTTGRSVTDAIRISRRTAPGRLLPEVGRLVDRLNNRWDTADALRGFADALDSPDADGVVAALILAARRGANGASLTLSALADSIQDQLKGRRLIETERAKPYVVVRQVTIISLVTLGAVMFVLSPSFFAGYGTPLGQLILSVLVVLYLGSLILLRRKAQQHRGSGSWSGPGDDAYVDHVHRTADRRRRGDHHRGFGCQRAEAGTRAAAGSRRAGYRLERPSSSPWQAGPRSGSARGSSGTPRSR